MVIALTIQKTPRKCIENSYKAKIFEMQILPNMFSVSFNFNIFTVNLNKRFSLFELSLFKLKDRIDELNCPGIYSISGQCGVFYIGQGKCSLCFRLCEHKLSTRNKKPTNTPFLNIAGKIITLLNFILL